MKILKKIPLAAIACVLLLSACKSNNAGHTTDTADQPKNQIVLVERYLNYAEGYQDRGSFIDLNGNVYEFDFSTYTYDDSNRKDGSEFICELEEIRSNTEPVQTVSSEKVDKCFQKIEFIDKDAEIIREPHAFDAGQLTLYVYDSKISSLIMLNSHGDYEEELNDKYAKEIVKIYDEYIDK